MGGNCLNQFNFIVVCNIFRVYLPCGVMVCCEIILNEAVRKCTMVLKGVESVNIDKKPQRP